LRRRSRAVALREEDVVVLVGLERRVEVDEIDALVLDVPAQDVEVVAVVQVVQSSTETEKITIRVRAG
jgi:hypothetical protein